MIDLNSMPVEDLKKLRKDVEKAIASFEERRKKEALVALEAKASEMGFSLSDLTGAGKKVSAPKFQNPENPSQTWTGRGRQPTWFKAAIAAGKSEDDMRIAG